MKCPCFRIAPGERAIVRSQLVWPVDVLVALFKRLCQSLVDSNRQLRGGGVQRRPGTRGMRIKEGLQFRQLLRFCRREVVLLGGIFGETIRGIDLVYVRRLYDCAKLDDDDFLGALNGELYARRETAELRAAVPARTVSVRSQPRRAKVASTCGPSPTTTRLSGSPGVLRSPPT